MVIAPEAPTVLRRPGWVVVARKEFADNLLSVRFFILLLLTGLAAIGAVQAAASNVGRAAPAASEAPAMLLRLLTVVPSDLPSFFSFFGLVGFLSPLLGIAFGFDAINTERSQRTLPRLLAQPIRRDDVLIGKFVAGLGAIALTLGVLAAVVVGLGIFRLGVTPDATQIARLVAYLVVAVLYVGVWLALAIFASVLVRRAATSALIAIAAWIVFAIFWSLFAGLLAGTFAKVPDNPTFAESLRNARLELALDRISPETLYEEASTVLLLPEVRSLSILTPERVDRAVPGELDLPQSLLVAWPQITALVSLVVVLFAGTYVVFMRQEVRA
ncbi:MAG: ABC transporter permease [Acidimicrobiia bacterium]